MFMLHFYAPNTLDAIPGGLFLDIYKTRYLTVLTYLTYLSSDVPKVAEL